MANRFTQSRRRNPEPEDPPLHEPQQPGKGGLNRSQSLRETHQFHQTSVRSLGKRDEEYSLHESRLPLTSVTSSYSLSETYSRPEQTFGNGNQGVKRTVLRTFQSKGPFGQDLIPSPIEEVTENPLDVKLNRLEIGSSPPRKHPVLQRSNPTSMDLDDQIPTFLDFQDQLVPERLTEVNVREEDLISLLNNASQTEFSDGTSRIEKIQNLSESEWITKILIRGMKNTSLSFIPPLIPHFPFLSSMYMEHRQRTNSLSISFSIFPPSIEKIFLFNFVTMNWSELGKLGNLRKLVVVHPEGHKGITLAHLEAAKLNCPTLTQFYLRPIELSSCSSKQRLQNYENYFNRQLEQVGFNSYALYSKERNVTLEALINYIETGKEPEVIPLEKNVSEGSLSNGIMSFNDKFPMESLVISPKSEKKVGKVKAIEILNSYLLSRLVIELPLSTIVPFVSQDILKNLSFLKLSNMAVEPDEIEKLVKKSPALSKLELTRVKLPGKEIYLPFLKQVITYMNVLINVDGFSIQVNQREKKFEIGGFATTSLQINDIFMEDPPDIFHTFSLKQMTFKSANPIPKEFLTQIQDLSLIDIQCKTCLFLERSLSFTTQLRSLTLDFVFSETPFKFRLSWLKNCVNLQVLSISRMKIKKEEVESLVFPNLLDFSLCSCSFSGSLMRRLGRIFPVVETLEIFAMSGDSLPSLQTQELIKEAKNIYTLTLLIVEGIDPLAIGVEFIAFLGTLGVPNGARKVRFDKNLRLVCKASCSCLFSCQCLFNYS